MIYAARKKSCPVVSVLSSARNKEAINVKPVHTMRRTRESRDVYLTQRAGCGRGLPVSYPSFGRSVLGCIDIRAKVLCKRFFGTIFWIQFERIFGTDKGKNSDTFEANFGQTKTK